MLQRCVISSAILVAVGYAAAADAQTYTPQKPRRQFVTVSTDWLNTQPLHFLEHPLEDLVGRAVASAQFQNYEYRTRDEAIQIDVQEFSKHGRGAGITVYPLGISVGPAFALRTQSKISQPSASASREQAHHRTIRFRARAPTISVPLSSSPIIRRDGDSEATPSLAAASVESPVS